MNNYCIVSDRRKRASPEYYVNQSANRFTSRGERGSFTSQQVLAVFNTLPSKSIDGTSHEWRIVTDE